MRKHSTGLRAHRHRSPNRPIHTHGVGGDQNSQDQASEGHQKSLLSSKPVGRACAMQCVRGIFRQHAHEMDCNRRALSDPSTGRRASGTRVSRVSPRTRYPIAQSSLYQTKRARFPFDNMRSAMRRVWWIRGRMKVRPRDRIVKQSCRHATRGSIHVIPFDWVRSPMCFLFALDKKSDAKLSRDLLQNEKKRKPIRINRRWNVRVMINQSPLRVAPLDIHIYWNRRCQRFRT